MLVEQLMTAPAFTCRGADSLDRAAQVLWDRDLGSLPVVGADGALIGVITDRDICMAAYLRGQTLADIAVAQAMAGQVYACAPGDPIGVAEKIMTQYQVRRVPVVDEGGRVVGVLSLTDLARAAEREDGRRLPVVTDAEVARTLVAICAPRREGESAALP